MIKKNIFLMNMVQVIKSPMFYISILGVLLVSYIGTKDYIEPTIGIANVIDLLINLSMFKNLIFIFAALSCCSSFCIDWNYMFIRPLVIRSGVKSYAWAKVLVCALTSFTVVFSGISLYCLLLSTKMPIGNLQNNLPYGALLDGSFPAVYLIVVIFIYSLAASMWSVLALAFSSYIPNSFVAIASPIIFSYLVEELTKFLPIFLNTYYLTRSRDILRSGDLVNFIYTSSFFLILIFIFGNVFLRRVGRRINNEVV